MMLDQFSNYLTEEQVLEAVYWNLHYQVRKEYDPVLVIADGLLVKCIKFDVSTKTLIKLIRRQNVYIFFFSDSILNHFQVLYVG